jgi:hypothetical protein
VWRAGIHKADHRSLQALMPNDGAPKARTGLRPLRFLSRLLIVPALLPCAPLVRSSIERLSGVKSASLNALKSLGCPAAIAAGWENMTGQFYHCGALSASPGDDECPIDTQRASTRPVELWAWVVFLRWPGIRTGRVPTWMPLIVRLFGSQG